MYKRTQPRRGGRVVAHEFRLGRQVPLATTLTILAGLVATPVHAVPDFQRLLVGSGVAAVECISAGTNGTVESVLAGDDTIPNPPALPQVLAGANGICETTALADDVQQIPVSQGLANGRHILSGRDVINDDDDNGICDNAAVFLPGSDDLLLVPAGQSTPRQVGVAPTPPGTVVSTTAAADDETSAIICPGSNNSFESVIAGDDVLQLNSFNCFFCVSSVNSCIIPGADGILDSTASGDDFALQVILTGPDGVCDSAAAVGDEQQIPVGEGFQESAGFPETTVCVDTGANGVAESTLCGNGAIDRRPSGQPEQCDDGNLTNGDGCDDDVASGGNCSPTACGNGVISAGEQCDDGNTDDDDNCTAACTVAVCGDSSTCSDAACTTGPSGGPEECDDGNLIETDGCTSSCEQLLCGDGALDAGEQCDDGNTKNTDACLNNCTIAACGDGFKCTSSVCTTGPGGGPEECDPPDGLVCTAQCGKIESPCRDGIINGLCTAPASEVGNVCVDNIDCDSSSGAGDGVCGVIETCDDGNSSDKDGCPTNCQIATCGDGFVHEIGGTEQCDDGNLVPGDGCDSSCQTECGNGLIDGSCSLGLPFGTPCAANSDCDTSLGASDGRCTGEACDVGCGIATVDGACTAGASGGCRTGVDCDTSPGAGDGVCQGTTCGPGCTGGLAADGSVSPLCIAGNTGAPCSTNGDCDSAPAAGDGVCRGPACATSTPVDLFCGTIPPICSEFCQVAGCGNAVRECSEQCDAGAANGEAGTGCDVDCTRTGIIGRNEVSKARECVSAWSLDDAPKPLTKKKQTCSDCSAGNKTGVCSAGSVGSACCQPSEAIDCDSSPGAGDGRCNACDADAASNVCTFRVAVCLNRLGVPGCDSQALLSYELRGMKVARPEHALATARITEAVRGLSPGKCTSGLVGTPCTDNQGCETSLGAADGTCSAVILGRCRKGAKNTTCTLGNDFECDRTFGADNGRCDLGTGVRFLPSISQADDGGDQQSTCTDSLDIPVAKKSKLRLRSITRRSTGRSDKDSLTLVCE